MKTGLIRMVPMSTSQPSAEKSASDQLAMPHKCATGKAAWSRMLWADLRDVRQAMDFGDAKSAPHSWQQIPDARQFFFDAAMRHLIAMQTGEEHDRETGLPHVAHAIASLLYLSWHNRHRALSEPTGPAMP
jgi:hypothetical protein